MYKDYPKSGIATKIKRAYFWIKQKFIRHQKSYSEVYNRLEEEFRNEENFSLFYIENRNNRGLKYTFAGIPFFIHASVSGNITLFETSTLDEMNEALGGHIMHHIPTLNMLSPTGEYASFSDSNEGTNTYPKVYRDKLLAFIEDKHG